MYELLDQHRMFQPACLDDFKNLKDLLDRFEVRTGACQSPLGLDAPHSFTCLVSGPGEGRRLHEVRQVREDSRQQQDGQMGKQEGITDGWKRKEPSQVQLSNQRCISFSFFYTFVGLRLNTSSF